MRRTLVLSMLLCLGCGTKQAATTVIPLTEVAPEVMQAAEKALPKVKFTSARRVQINGEDALEIRGTLPSGKVREVEVTASGRVLGIE